MGLDATRASFIDKTLIDLDGTDNKSRLGANALVAVSMAVAKAAADELCRPLYRYFGGTGAMQMPVPMMNIIKGGARANNSLDMQEFMIVPVGAQSFRDALRCGAEVFHALKGLLQQRGVPTTVGDEGGFAPNLPGHEAALQLCMEAIDKAGYQAGQDVLLALDCASSGVLQGRALPVVGETCETSSGQFADYLAALADKYPLISIEDGMAENGGTAGKSLPNLGRKIQIVGDDLFVTNTKDLREGIAEGVANSILIKVSRSAPSPERLPPSKWPSAPATPQ